MSKPVTCDFCEGPFKWSDWSPFCSAGCEHLATLAMERAKGAAAERARIVAALKQHSAYRMDEDLYHLACEIEADAQATAEVTIETAQQQVVALKDEIKRIRREARDEERTAVITWLSRNPGISRGPECVTPMSPLECADAIAAGKHQNKD